ncbi:MAG: hypothetical protein KAT56_10185, partial [Sedimentisphaerales bacterium]|nr:hypothetical protein [Sedimentisphaerales bacterium]
MRIALFIILYSALSTISVFGQAVRVYTSGAHFDEGELLDVNHSYVHDQLQLSKHGTTIFPIIWIANADEGTVSKLDTQTGRELGRYYTGPRDYNVARYTTHRYVNYETKWYCGSRYHYIVPKYRDKIGYKDRQVIHTTKTGKEAWRVFVNGGVKV